MLRCLLLSLCLLTVSASLLAQDFPSETTVCRMGPYTLNNPLLNTTGLVFQWEQSFDGGGSWSDLLGEDMADLVINSPNSGISYRLRYANDIGCLANPTCASLTSATRLTIQIPTFFQSATICAGEAWPVGDELLTTGGNHTTIINTGECDSVVNTFVLLHESYDLRYTATLCPGEVFRGRTYSSDTTFTEQFLTINGCDSMVTYEVDVSFPSSLNIDGEDMICAGEQTTLSIPGQFTSIEWSNGSTGNSIEATSTGSYSALVTNSQGCSISLQHELQVIELSAIITPQTPVCPGTASGSLDIQASGDDDLLYSFDGGNSFGVDNSMNNLSAGDYQLIVESPLGCQFTTDYTLSDAPPINLFSQQATNQAIERGDSIRFSIEADFEVTAWQWNNRIGLSCTDCPNPLARPTFSTTYEITAMAPGGCSVSKTFQIDVLDSRRAYTPTAFSPDLNGQNDYFEIFPGPRTETIANFTIFDRWGGTLYRATNALAPGDERLRWDGKSNNVDLPAGTYGYAATLNFQDGSSKVVSGTINLMR